MNVFKDMKKQLQFLQKVIKQYPVVPLYGDHPISLYFIIERIPHFDRSTMSALWQDPSSATAQVSSTSSNNARQDKIHESYDVLLHYPRIKESFDQLQLSLAALHARRFASPFSLSVDSANLQLASQVTETVQQSLVRIGEWTGTLLLVMAWKYTHPVSVARALEKKSAGEATGAGVGEHDRSPSVSSTGVGPGGATSPDLTRSGTSSSLTGGGLEGIEYERVVRYNFSDSELSAVVEILSMIKSAANALLLKQGPFSEIIRFNIHHQLQQLVQADLQPLLHRAHKHSKGPLLQTLLQIRDSVADWGASEDSTSPDDYVNYSRKQKRNVDARHPARLAGPSYTQWHMLRLQIRSLLLESGGSSSTAGGGGKQVFGSLFGKSELEKEDVAVLEAFLTASHYYPYLYDYSNTILKVSDCSDLWLREFFLEVTKCVQFPIEMSLPWILVEHAVLAKVRQRQRQRQRIGDDVTARLELHWE